MVKKIKIIKGTSIPGIPVIEVLDKRAELLILLKQRMPACFDREPQGMNSGVERLADSILELLK